MMDYYFSAASDAAALSAKDLPAGPAPGSDGFLSVEAKGVIACPHLEQLVSIATGNIGNSLVPELSTLWPSSPEASSESDLEPGPSIMRLPDSLRDALGEVVMTQQIAAAWANELWDYDLTDAERVGTEIIQLAKAAKAEHKSLYWWMEI